MERRIYRIPEGLRELQYSIMSLISTFGRDEVVETFRKSLRIFKANEDLERAKEILKRQLANAFIVYVLEFLEDISQMEDKDVMFEWLEIFSKDDEDAMIKYYERFIEQ